MNRGNRTILIFVILLLVLSLFAASYWYFLMNGPAGEPRATPAPGGGFVPFGGTGQIATSSPEILPTPGVILPTGTPAPTAAIPALRLLSNTPIGGYGASTTGSTTIVRWIDRGRGNVVEAAGNSSEIVTLSNTVLPRIYESAWNRNLTAFVASMLAAGSDVPTTLYSELRARATTTGATSTINEAPAGGLSLTQYELRGKNLPAGIMTYAVSPGGDKVFMFVNENGAGAGYVSNFDGSSLVRIFTTPLTQIVAEWPETNTIAITTKAASGKDGYLYFVNPKTGVWKKILGPVPGLSARTSHDARFVFASSVGIDQVIKTALYSASGTTTDTAIQTLADKCAWGNFYKDVIYCAVPTHMRSAVYPDDWYRGDVSFADRIWQVNATTGESAVISGLVNGSGRPIDAINLSLDAKDNFLFFMHKNGLSLWSLDLVRTE